LSKIQLSIPAGSPESVFWSPKSPGRFRLKVVLDTKKPKNHRNGFLKEIRAASEIMVP
jgi:hypothetical protein